MPKRCQPLLPAAGWVLLTWLVPAAVFFMAQPAAAGCPFRHGLRFAAPGSRVHPQPAANMRSSGEQYNKSEEPTSLGRNNYTTTSRRLKQIIGLGYDVGLDKNLPKDTPATTPPGSKRKGNPSTTPHVRNPYGPPASPTNPAHKDWASVVSACKAVGEIELRLNNFFIRAAFHDGMAVSVDCTTCSGLDGSLLLNPSEMIRPENAYENFSEIASRVLLKIARWFKVSTSDVLAVCAAVATETLGGPKVFRQGYPLRVGRQDNPAASAEAQLPPADMTADDFAAFWKKHNFSVEEGVALMGSHSLLDEQACYRGRDNNPRDYCNPATERCNDIRMFSWKNHYYVDACTPSVKVVPNEELPELAVYEALTEADMIRTDSVDEFRADLRREICKWSSPERRATAQSQVLAIRKGAKVNIPPPEKAAAFWDASYLQCMKSNEPIIRANCRHPQIWPYTLNDAHLAVSCQAESGANLSPGETEVKEAMLRYLNQDTWYAEYSQAFHKMVNRYASFRNIPKTNNAPALITGTECSSGYAINRAGAKSATLCSTRKCPLNVPRASSCPASCLCKTVFIKGKKVRSLAAPADTALPADQPPSGSTFWTPPSDAVVGMPLAEAEQVERTLLPDVAPISMPAEGSLEAPRSPYGEPDKICPAADGTPYEVDGYPGTPYKATPFAVEYDLTAMEPAKPEHTVCREDGQTPDGTVPHCQVTYSITSVAFRAKLWNKTLPACEDKPPTELLGYGGRVPGPLIVAPAGHQLMIRFINDIDENALDGEPHWPCLGDRKGRPLSQHLHGSASLAPYDGWADDVTCKDEYKDYVFPNQRPTTAWYHDHGIHVTGDNAYHGLAGWYIITDKKSHGGCGEPYNLENMDERLIMLADKVLDSQCQLYYNHAGPHRNNLYGDINMVNGQPWPNMPLEARWYRLRFLNAAMVRPYLIKIKDSSGTDVAQDICHVIATDGGYRAEPVKFPAEGMQMGVAERYEVVCNFEKFAGQTLYLWNGRNEEMMKAVPYFCYSHLIARIQVAAAAAKPAAEEPAPAPEPIQEPGTATGDTAAGTDMATGTGRRLLAWPAVGAAGGVGAAYNASQVPTHVPLNRVLSPADIAAANDLIAKDQPHRTFKFGRRQGHWVINGETWDSATIAADDVGHNTWELWLLRTGGGWFHPIHMHLVDFYVIKRGTNEGTDGLFAYERHGPKDVVYLGPSQKIWVIARFGAHRGSYMFHCHNLVHEDYDMLRAMTIVSGEKGQYIRNRPSQFQLVTVADTMYTTYGDPMAAAAAAKPINGNGAPELTTDYSKDVLNKGLYRIFYPAKDDERILFSDANPWRAPVCRLSEAAP